MPVGLRMTIGVQISFNYFSVRELKLIGRNYDHSVKEIDILLLCVIFRRIVLFT